jgi:hypothetical protein
MKNRIWISSVMIAGILSAGSVMADDAAPVPQSTPGAVSAGAKHPCRELEQACKSAGFAKGQHKQAKGLWKDCMDPILDGKSVQGVSADASVVQACKAKKAEHRAKEKSEKKSS